jgi:hypothetical protein
MKPWGGDSSTQATRRGTSSRLTRSAAYPPTGRDRSENRAPAPASRKNSPSPQAEKNTSTTVISSLCSAFLTCQSSVSNGWTAW